MTYWNPDSDPGLESWFTGAVPDLTGGDCATVDPELFFPAGPGSHNEKKAKAICAECPLLAECREYAISVPNMWGTWGGTTHHERKDIRAARAAQEVAA